MDIVKTLTEFSEMAGPSGFEQAVAARAADHLAQFCDEVSIDKLYNVCGTRRASKPDAPTLMLVAHLDEIGLMVTKIEEGFVRFRTIGGIDPRVLPAREVKIMTEPPLHGVITSVPPHLQTVDESKKPFELAELAIDAGLSQQRAAELIPVGTPVVYAEKAHVLGDKILSGKSLDDRACFVMLLRTLELLDGKELPVELIVNASSMEEINDGGAKVAAFAQAPDYAIAVDVTFGETPDGTTTQVFKLGDGVPVVVGPNANRKLVQRIVDAAKRHDIKVHREITPGPSGTDAWPMQVVGYGTATGVVGLPLRYMHTPVEAINLDDLEQGAKLLAALVMSFGEDVETNA